MSNKSNLEIDKSLYSRQLYTIGTDAMNDLKNTSVLISGMSGLGVGIARDIIMFGVKSVTLHDTGIIKLKELASNYYANELDIGKSRVDVVKYKLSSLNSNVVVLVNSDILTENIIKQHQIIVVCDKLPQTQFNIDKIALKYGTKFILANSVGLMGSIFCNFGNEFTTIDTNGETPSDGIITQVKDGNFITDKQHKLYNGDKVMIKLGNNIIQDEINKIINSVTFNLKTLKQANQLYKDASFTQHKQTMTINFKPLRNSIMNPDFTMIMTEDFDRQRLLHDFFVSFGMFVSNNNRFPRPWNDEDMDKILNLVKCENEEQKNVIKKLCYTASGKSIEIDSIVASITAQEVIKAASKKYTPINQWLYIDKSDMIDDNKIVNNDITKQWKLEEFDNIPKNRFFGRTLIFGKTFQKKIQDSTIFIVGSGAIGCEHLKNFGMMGVGSGTGKIIITDMDTIEMSNLNRQFLFRNTDIGKYKSECAKNAITEMIPGIKIIAQQNKVGHETLSLYNQKFFSQLSCVLTALDNIDARKFVDNLCLIHEKCLIDSGTLGTKGNIQIVVPHLTETYGQSRDPPEEEFPVCTIKNFPYLIEHCIQWSRDLFEGLFVKAPQNFMRYKLNSDKIKQFTQVEQQELSEIVKDVNFVKDNMACHIKECITFSYNLWHEYFRDQIYNLVIKFPENAVTSDNLPFWMGTKKFPIYGEFIQTEYNMLFLESVTNLWSEVCGINEKVTNKQLLNFLKKVKNPKLITNASDVAIDEKQQKEIEEKAKGKPIEELFNMLPNLNEIKDIEPKILEFEKDNDTNFHVDFVTSASNLRATNYGIQHADKFKTKGIAGKIIPAIITTTSVVSGIVVTEFVKTMQNFNISEKYSNTFVNLALPILAFSEPIKVQKHKIGKLEFTQWDKLKFSDLTIRQLSSSIMDKIKDNKLCVAVISNGQYQFFSSYHSANLIKRRKDMTISEIYKEITKLNPPDLIELSIIVEKEYPEIDEEGNDISEQYEDVRVIVNIDNFYKK